MEWLKFLLTYFNQIHLIKNKKRGKIKNDNKRKR